jgi:hypothetical protein
MDVVASIERRDGTPEAADGRPWCVVVRCPDGCRCADAGRVAVIRGFASPGEAQQWRDEKAAAGQADDWRHR